MSKSKSVSVPVVDAESKMDIQVRPKDITGAVPGDALHCALARGAEHLPGVVEARFYRTVALLVYRDRAVRYMIPAATRAALMLFDLTDGKVALPGVYTIVPPNASNRFDYKRAANRRHLEARRKDGPKYQRPNTGVRVDPLSMLGVRSGSGQVRYASLVEVYAP
jgi:hypothetical protein